MVNSIKFAPNLIPLILNGSKIKTYRYGGRYAHLRAGDRLNVVDSASGSYACVIQITNFETMPFGSISINDPGHEIYESKEHMRKQFAVYYGKTITDGELVQIITFKIIPS